jgi:hypothetical protein
MINKIKMKSIQYKKQKMLFSNNEFNELKKELKVELKNIF